MNNCKSVIPAYAGMTKLLQKKEHSFYNNLSFIFNKNKFILHLRTLLSRTMQIPEIPNLIHYAIPFFAITILIEGYIIAKHSTKIHSVKDAVASITTGLIGNVFIGLITKVIIIFVFTSVWQYYRISTVPFAWWS